MSQSSQEWLSTFDRNLRGVGGHEWSPGAQLLASWDHRGLTVYDPKAARTVAVLQTNPDLIAWSSCGKRLATTEYFEPGVSIWDLDSFEPQAFGPKLSGPACWHRTSGFASAAGNTIHFWNASSGEVSTKLSEEFGEIDTVHWCPDGTVLAARTAKDARRLLLLDPVSAELIRVLEDQNLSSSNPWSPDGQTLAIVDRNDHSQLLSPDGERTLRVLGHDIEAGEDVEAIGWSPEGRRLASWCDWTSSIGIWDAASGDHLFDITADELFDDYTADQGFLWSPEGSRLIVHNKGVAQIWDATRGVKVADLEIPRLTDGSQLATMSWSPDGSRIAARGVDRLVILCDGTSGECLEKWEGQLDTEYDTKSAWSPDGSFLTYTTPLEAETLGTEVWNVETKALVSLLPPLAIWSAVDNQLVTSGPEGEALLWGTPQPGGLVAIATSGDVETLSWVNNDKQLLIDSNGGFELRDAETGSVVFSEGEASSAVWSDSSQMLAWFNWDDVFVKNLSNEETWNLETVSTGPASWDPQGRLLAFEHELGIHIWDVRARNYKVLPGVGFWVSNLAWSPDSTRLAAIGHQHIAIWNRSAEDFVVLELEGLEGAARRQGFTASVWSPDGSCLAAADGNRLSLWDGETGELLTRLISRKGDARTVVWGETSNAIATSGQSGAQMWLRGGIGLRKPSVSGGTGDIGLRQPLDQEH